MGIAERRRRTNSGPTQALFARRSRAPRDGGSLRTGSLCLRSPLRGPLRGRTLHNDETCGKNRQMLSPLPAVTPFMHTRRLRTGELCRLDVLERGKPKPAGNDPPQNQSSGVAAVTATGRHRDVCADAAPWRVCQQTPSRQAEESHVASRVLASPCRARRTQPPGVSRGDRLWASAVYPKGAHLSETRWTPQTAPPDPPSSRLRRGRGSGVDCRHIPSSRLTGRFRA